MWHHTSSELPTRAQLDEQGVHSAYPVWLNTNPPAGEVFADTGEASPTEVAKIIWRPTAREAAALRLGCAASVAGIQNLFEHGDLDAYGAEMTAGVNALLESAGVNPDLTMMGLSE